MGFLPLYSLHVVTCVFRQDVCFYMRNWSKKCVKMPQKTIKERYLDDKRLWKKEQLANLPLGFELVEEIEVVGENLMENPVELLLLEAVVVVALVVPYSEADFLRWSSNSGKKLRGPKVRPRNWCC